MMRQFRSARRFAVLLATAVAMGACSTNDAHEVEVDSMRITVGGATVTVNSTGAITGGPLSIAPGVATAVTVSFRDAAGADALVDHADDFQVNISVPAGVTFTRTGPFAGTLTGASAGVRTLQFSLLHIAENHEDFGPFNVPVTVVGVAANAR